jgi:1,4-alpha-glucan branching enzyme
VTSAPKDQVDALVGGRVRDPHVLLGAHPNADSTVVRAWRPEAQSVSCLVDGAVGAKLERVHPGGLFEGTVEGRVLDYELEVAYAPDRTFVVRDPYSFPPTLGDVDVHLIGEGRHRRLHTKLGAHHYVMRDVDGTGFAVWAPNALSVRLVGNFNSWDGRLNPMRMIGSSGVWELFLPGVGDGALYKFEIVTADGRLVLKTDPFAFRTEPPPGTAAVVHRSRHEWRDHEWMGARSRGAALAGPQETRRGAALAEPQETKRRGAHEAPMSIYEVHLGSWRRGADGRQLTYRETAPLLADYCTEMGFTHVELLPIAEHPFGGSWGYQVSNYFAPTARFGDPDDFRYFVDTLHRAGVGVICDWVPAHFPKDEWALARFDGTALYEHMDPRQGEHPDWGTLVFNFGRNEVRNFLISNALFWCEEYHLDGLRVDAVASMLYLDYSRNEGEWVPNRYGGRENLEAIEFLKELNAVVHGEHPGVVMTAEESTAWPGVSRPTYLGGLGFGFKWNMGWMHDTLDYFAKDPVHRRWHHNQLTFSLIYAFSENYVLPLSHDEVVHGKGSLVAKMPGDRWEKFANLRSLFGYMWAHPGKQLLFMGGELAQEREWTHDHSIDWHLLDDPSHAGVRDLVADLNRTYMDLDVLWRLDSSPEGFRWIDANDADNNVVSFYRTAGGNAHLVCVCNLSPVVRTGFRLGFPRAGRYREIINTDAQRYGGSNVGNLGEVSTEPTPWHGLDQSAEILLPPLAVLWLYG